VSYDEVCVNHANDDALGSAKTVLNVGAGAGSGEPAGKQAMTVEPSMKMIL